MSRISYIEYHLILEYLYKIYENKLKNDEISVPAFFELNPLGGGIWPVQDNFDPITMRNFFGLEWYIIDLRYKNRSIWILCRAFIRASLDGARPSNDYFLDYSLNEKGEELEINLISILKKLAITNSHLNGKILRIINSPLYHSVLDLLEILPPSSTSLDDIFLPKGKREYIDIFINSLKNCKSGNLRYLFNGQPGTAKTQIIYSIINCVGSNATFIILENKSIPLNDIFDFCSFFEPSVLVIDDLDLLIEERNRTDSKSELSVFLSNLDGLNHKNLFILATTNDKRFVDIAAQRH